MTAPRPLLLNPGPVTLSERVRAALLRDDLCHRESDFVALFRDVRDRLSRVYPASRPDYVPILITGSGTAAVEAMVVSLVPAGGAVVVAANGVYGERMEAMAKAVGRTVRVARSAWGAPIDLDAVRAALAATPKASHVLAVHHETTTGRLNDIDALASVCREFGARLLLDTVSSFGAEEIRFAEWNLDACAVAGNKCLHGTPGLSAVLVAERIFAERPSGAPGLYLDLHRYYAARDGAPPYTPAVHAFYALQEALREFEEGGGWQARRNAYRTLARQVMADLEALQIHTWLPDRDSYSCVLTSYRLPQSVTYDRLHDAAKAEGFVIYAGQGDFQGRMFRVSTMGAVAAADMSRFTRLVDRALQGAS
jgi:2-aminoethylphosphonate-pyruvate transaminase